MLTVAEVRQAARDAAGPHGKIEHRTRQVEAEVEVTVSLARTDADRSHGVVKRATTTVDEPEVLVRFGTIAVVFTVDASTPLASAGLPPARVTHGRWCSVPGMSSMPSAPPGRPRG